MSRVEQRCPDSVHGDHGPADGAGRCPWCGHKYTNAKRVEGAPPLDELAAAYHLFYGQHGGSDEC